MFQFVVPGQSVSFVFVFDVVHVQVDDSVRMSNVFFFFFVLTNLVFHKFNIDDNVLSITFSFSLVLYSSSSRKRSSLWSFVEEFDYLYR